MNSGADRIDGDLLLALQSGLPFDARPFARVGEPLGLSEADVLVRVRRFFDEGIARRFGAVFDARGLGYESTLCSADVPAQELEEAARRLDNHPGVTHCYEREGRPNLWFTLTAHAARLDEDFKRLSARLAPYEVWSLPAVRRFKIEVVFDTRADRNAPPEKARAAAPAERPPALALSAREQAVVRRLQGNIPLSAEPFGPVARDCGYAVDELLALLAAWKAAAVLRRVALILRHRELGFVANGMCVWTVTPEAVEEAGRKLAACPEVTHCYQRLTPPAFPYNLFAMIHADNVGQARQTFERIGAQAGIKNGKMLVSVREFKKSSPRFFCEAEDSVGR